ncbi:MAG: major capsid protein [Pseudomonadota bacterium]
MVDSIAFDTATLVGVVPNLKTSQNWMLDRYFTGLVESDSEEVVIDVDVGKRRMSPFVSPLVEGKLVEQRRFQTNKFKPAYVKDKRAPDLRKPVRRMIGEKIGGNLSGAEREMANLEFEMTDQVDMLNRRLEWMACQAMMTAQVPIVGDGVNALVDFGRDAALTVTLTGNNRWGISANFLPDGRDPVPTGNIEDWQALILKKSGATVTDIVFTTTPWKRFQNAEGVQGAIYYPKLGGEQNNEIRNGPEIKKGAIYKGRWGQYDLWLYNDWYVDDNDVEQPMITDGVVILSGQELMGTRAFGMIMDPKFNYGPMAYAPKTWITEDPAQRLIMLQSAPLVIPSRVNACFAATVI